MFLLRAPEPLVLLVLCLVLVAEAHSVTTQRASHRVANNDVQADEVAVSLVVNQLAVIKLLNESSNTCSCQERQLQEMFEFGVKAGQLKEELRIIKETALDEIQDKKAEVLNEARLSTQEATRTLQNIKSNALTEMQEKKSDILKELRKDTGPKTYRKYSVQATQPQALEACQQLGGRLALPTNDEEEEQIRRLIGVGFSTDHWANLYWISGTDQQQEGNWVDSVTGEPLRYTNFRPGEPNNGGGKEHCLNKSTLYAGWNDAPCNGKGAGYVCEFTE